MCMYVCIYIYIYTPYKLFKQTSAEVFYKKYIYIYIYIYIHKYIYIYMVFITEGLFEVAIESWPEWDLNPRPLNKTGKLVN